MKIYYLQDPSGGLDKFMKYKDTIEKFINRGARAHGLNLEKLRISDKTSLYSIRIDGVARILMVKYQGHYCLVDVVENHEYDKSRFIKNPQLFKRLLSTAGEAIELPPIDAWIHADAAAGACSGGQKSWRWEAADVDDELPAVSEPWNLMLSKPLDYQGQFIALSTQQEGVLERRSLPLIVAGHGGSGKSMIALSMLSQYLREHNDGAEAFRILYVCESAELVKEMKKIWAEMLGEHHPFADRVEFKTYAQMIVEQLGIHEENILAKEDFLAWYARITPPKAISISGDIMWQECRIRSGYKNDEAYIKLGERRSNLPQEALGERAFVCEVYHRFLRSTIKADTRCPALEDLKQAIRQYYQLIAVDEAQGLSFAQLRFLYDLSQGNIAFFVGHNQTTEDNISRLPFLKDLLFEHGYDEKNLTSLGPTYRCSQAVTLLANELIRIKYLLTGGAPDTQTQMLEVADTSLAPGTASLFDPANTTETARFSELAHRNADVFVVTHADYVKEASALFRTGQVFTPEGVRGLGARVVILWRLLDDDRALSAAHDMGSEKMSSPQRSGHRAKPGVGNRQYEAFCNALIVAATRAMDHVVLFQNDHHRITPLMSRLRQALKTTQGRTDGLSEMTPSTEEAFARKALELYQRGHRQQALGIFERNLGGKSDQFETFIIAQASRFKDTASTDEVMRMYPADELVESGGPGTDSAPHPCLSGAGVPEESIAPLERHIAALPVTGGPSELKQQLKEALSSRNGKEIGRLFMNLETMALLQDLFDDLFASIQGGLAWIGNKKTLRPLWFDLASNTEHGVLIFQRLVHMGLFIGDDIWRFIPKKDPGAFPEYSFLYWLLLTPEGHAILTELLTKQDISTILTSDFLMKGIPGHPSVCPLSMIFTSEPGLKLLSYLIKKYPKVFKDIPAKTWLNLHPTIQSEDGRPLSLLHTFLRTAAGEMALKLLISQNPSLKRVFLDQLTSIIEAIRRDDTRTIKIYHLLGVDFNIEFSSPYTLPYLAIDFRSKAVLKLLWEYHVDFYKPSRDGGTPAIRAVVQNDPEILGILHALGVDFNRPGSEDIIRPVFQATIKGQEHLLGLLKEYGADLTIEITRGCTPALYAARHNYVGALNELHRLGVDLKKSTKTGLTPAVIAVEFNNSEALETILNLNPTIDINELFFYAVRKGHIPILRMLIHKGADCEQLHGVTPEHLMIIYKDTETSEEGRERIRECLEAAPPNILITALEYAEFCGKVDPLCGVLEEQASKGDESRTTIGDQLGQFGLLRRQAESVDAGGKTTEAPRI